MDENKQKLPFFTITFLKQYALVISAALLLLFFLFILMLSAFSSKNTIQPHIMTTPTSSKTPIPVNVYISTIPSPTGIQTTTKEDVTNEETLGRVTFSEKDIQGINFDKTLLSDGSSQYSTASNRPNRPNIAIIKNGLIVFQRAPMLGSSFTSFKSFHGQPDYVAVGSRFYGSNAVFYIYLTEGVAFAINPSTDNIFEQYSFQQITINEFKQKYGDDIIGAITAPSHQ